MIIKIVDKKTGLEKSIKEIKKYDTIYFECDQCETHFTRKHRPSSYPLQNKQLSLQFEGDKLSQI